MKTDISHENEAAIPRQPCITSTEYAANSSITVW